MTDAQKAAVAWLRTGRPANALRSMSEDELAGLAALTDETGNAVDNFSHHFAGWYENYLAARKTSEDEEP